MDIYEHSRECEKEYHDAVKAHKETYPEDKTWLKNWEKPVEPESDPIKQRLRLAHLRYIEAVFEIKKTHLQQEITQINANQVNLDAKIRRLFE